MALFRVSGDGGRAGEPVSRGKWEFDMDVDAVELLRAVKRGDEVGSEDGAVEFGGCNADHVRQVSKNQGYYR